MPRRNRNAWRNDLEAQKRRGGLVDLTPKQPSSTTRRERRRARRAQQNGQRWAA